MLHIFSSKTDLHQRQHLNIITHRKHRIQFVQSHHQILIQQKKVCKCQYLYTISFLMCFDQHCIRKVPQCYRRWQYNSRQNPKQVCKKNPCNNCPPLGQWESSLYTWPSFKIPEYRKQLRRYYKSLSFLIRLTRFRLLVLYMFRKYLNTLHMSHLLTRILQCNQ